MNPQIEGRAVEREASGTFEEEERQVIGCVVGLFRIRRFDAADGDLLHPLV